MSNVIVYGANGRTGRLVVTKALDAGHTVTAAVRRSQPFEDFRASTRHPQRLSVALVDATDSFSTAASAKGHDAAIAAISGGRKTNHLLARSARQLVDALCAAEVPDFQCVSSGAVEETGTGFVYGKIISPLFMRDLYADMREMEAIVQASDLQWSLVRPAYLVNAPARNRWRVQDGVNNPGGWRIGRADLAAFLVEQISARAWIHKRPSIAW